MKLRNSRKPNSLKEFWGNAASLLPPDLFGIATPCLPFKKFERTPKPLLLSIAKALAGERTYYEKVKVEIPGDIILFA